MSRDRVPRWLVTYLPKYIKLCYFYMYASQQSPYFMAIRHTLLTSVYHILCTEPNDRRTVLAIMYVKLRTPSHSYHNMFYLLKFATVAPNSHPYTRTSHFLPGHALSGTCFHGLFCFMDDYLGRPNKGQSLMPAHICAKIQ